MTSPGHGAVGVLQAPRPHPRRTPPAEPTAVSAGDERRHRLPLPGPLRRRAARRAPSRHGRPEHPASSRRSRSNRPPPPAQRRPAAPELEPPWTPADQPAGSRVEPRHGGGHRAASPGCRTRPAIDGRCCVRRRARPSTGRGHRRRADRPGGPTAGTACRHRPDARRRRPRHRRPSQAAGCASRPVDRPAPRRPADRPALERTAAPRRPTERTQPARRSPHPATHGEPTGPTDQADPGPRPEDQFGDRDPSVELAITEIAGHLTFTPNTVTAWYWLPEVRWAFRPDAEREALLVGDLRAVRRPGRLPAAPAPHHPAVPRRRVGPHRRRAHRRAAARRARRAPRWADHLVAAQRHLLSVNHAEGQTYLGVTFARRSLGDTLTERLLRTVRPGHRRRRTPQAGPHRRAVRRGARRVRHARPAGHRRRSWNGCSTARWRSCMAPPEHALPGHRRATGNAATCSP